METAKNMGLSLFKGSSCPLGKTRVAACAHSVAAQEGQAADPARARGRKQVRDTHGGERTTGMVSMGEGSGE
jgi:hypothetical protein